MKLTKHHSASLVSRDLVVRELLAALAGVLLQSGITPTLFAELAKQAFVSAATTISKFRNGTINRSRVAVITGLSRAEVRRLLMEQPSSKLLTPIKQSRAERVVSGWMSDRQFLGSRGRPKRLPLGGSQVSFTSLVKKFGGDVPHRAVLEELLRLGLVRQIRNELELDVPRTNVNAHAAGKLSALVPLLLDVIRLELRTASSGRDRLRAR